jgi:hypothetical protein
LFGYMRIIIPSLHSIPTLSLLPEFPSRHLRSSRIWGRSATVVSRSDPLLGGFSPYDCLPSPLLPGWVTHRRRHRLPVTAIPDPGASFFNTAALSLVPARSSYLPMGSRCKLLRRYNHIYRSSVHSSDRGFTGSPQPMLCAVSA